jgi:hypothetical protein
MFVARTAASAVAQSIAGASPHDYRRSQRAPARSVSEVEKSEESTRKIEDVRGGLPFGKPPYAGTAVFQQLRVVVHRSSEPLPFRTFGGGAWLARLLTRGALVAKATMKCSGC